MLDHCQVLHHLAEKYTNSRGYLFVEFMDLKGAFESICRARHAKKGMQKSPPSAPENLN